VGDPGPGRVGFTLALPPLQIGGPSSTNVVSKPDTVGRYLSHYCEFLLVVGQNTVLRWLLEVLSLFTAVPHVIRKFATNINGNFVDDTGIVVLPGL